MDMQSILLMEESIQKNPQMTLREFINLCFKKYEFQLRELEAKMLSDSFKLSPTPVLNQTMDPEDN